MQNKLFTTYEVASILGVHHTTIINWVKEKKLKAFVTPGGHRRIKKEDIKSFAEEYNIPILNEFDKKNKLVLIVDDNQDILDELSEALNGNNFEIDTATDGFQAAKKIYENNPDLILLDFKMLGMDGFEVCNVLKNDKKTARIPIFAVTSLSSDEDREKIKRCGVKEFFPKPIDIEKILKKIKKVMEL